jgi:hypothetical protein
MDTVETAICEVEQEVRRQMAPQSYKVAGAETAKETLTLLSSDAGWVQRFIACAIEESLKNSLASIKVLEQEIQEFETKHGMSSTEFLRRYEEDEIQETDETLDWCFTYRQHEHLRQTVQLLREVSFEL